MFETLFLKLIFRAVERNLERHWEQVDWVEDEGAGSLVAIVVESE